MNNIKLIFSIRPLNIKTLFSISKIILYLINNTKTSLKQHFIYNSFVKLVNAKLVLVSRPMKEKYQTRDNNLLTSQRSVTVFIRLMYFVIASTKLRCKLLSHLYNRYTHIRY